MKVMVLPFMTFMLDADGAQSLSLRSCINCVHCDDHFFIFNLLSLVHNQLQQVENETFLMVS